MSHHTSLLTIASALRSIADALAVLDAASTTSGPVVYTTAPGGPLPPRRSRRWLRDHAREIPGSTRSGGTRGRSVVWSVPREAYEQWLASKTTATKRDEPSAAVVDLDRWIAGAGYRSTRRTR